MTFYNFPPNSNKVLLFWGSSFIDVFLNIFF